MKPYYLINIIIIVLLFTYQYGRALDEAVGQSASNDSVTTSYESVFEQLMNLEIDPQQVAAVNNFLFQRDVGKFHLKEGELYFCKPIENRHYAAIFTGKGTFSFKPPTEIEQDQLNRFYETRKMEKDFNLLFIVFADSTYDQFRKQLTFEEGKISRKTKQQLDYCLKYLGKEKEKHFEYAILKTLLEQKYNKLFYAHFSKYKIQPMFFRINPFSEEEVQFMRRLKGPSYLYRPEVINQFHLQEEYQDSTYLTGEDKTSLHITDYKIDCALKGYKLDFSATTEIEFKSLTENQNWLTFWLFGELKVDSVFWDHGEKATFIKGNENPALWVKADHPLREGEQRKLTLHYHGDLLDRRKDWFFIRSSKGWYPQHGQRQRARFDITYHIPEEFQFASIGEKIFSKTEDGVITSRWKIDKPVRNISFNIGFFKEFKIESDSLPPITIYMAETGHLEIAHSLARLGVGSGKNMEKQVGEDVLNSIRFFRRKFGEPSADQFYATEIPYTHGEAFPGLIHLPWITFHRTTEGGYDATFRAHEVAHQWWGIGV
ncbi:MAG: hypothetical protein GWN16_09760, partial [Calditrichae bacterium]|nr:hypothetical protein [Calditrichia bacterium]